VPYDSQYPGLVDEVCWYFPELKFVFRHGCDPWADLTAKLLLKWPNLYYSTSGWAPKYYPKPIIDFANTRGADKIIYAGYYPYGLDLERIFRELPNVALKDEVWPKFLRTNALRVLGLGAG
jgi:predicted TIM-barrel fold metal-dependent hydrolase